MKYLKTFEKEATYNLDFTMEEEQEQVTSNSVEDKLVYVIDVGQQCLNMYGDKPEAKELLPIAETAIDVSQTCLNFINRKYGPIDNIKQTTKIVLDQCNKDLGKHPNVDLAMQCADACKKAAESL